jgi:uncharacterized protein (TIGR02246 family)
MSPDGSTPDEARAGESAAIAAAMLARWVDAWNRADGVAYGAEYWPDAELVDPFGYLSSGRAAIAQGRVGSWAGGLKGSRVTGTVRKIQQLGLEFLLVDLDMELALAQAPPPGTGLPVNDRRVIRTHLKHLLAKRDGVWRILSAQNTFAPNLPSAERGPPWL